MYQSASAVGNQTSRTHGARPARPPAQCLAQNHSAPLRGCRQNARCRWDQLMQALCWFSLVVSMASHRSASTPSITTIPLTNRRSREASASSYRRDSRAARRSATRAPISSGWRDLGGTTSMVAGLGLIAPAVCHSGAVMCNIPKPQVWSVDMLTAVHAVPLGGRIPTNGRLRAD